MIIRVNRDAAKVGEEGAFRVFLLSISLQFTRRGDINVSTLTARKNCQIKIFLGVDDVISLVVFALGRRKGRKKSAHEVLCKRRNIRIRAEIYLGWPRRPRPIQICRHFLSLAALVQLNFSFLILDVGIFRVGFYLCFCIVKKNPIPVHQLQ